MSFGSDVAKFAKLAGENADKVVRKVVLDIGERVVRRTPVGDPDYWESKPPKGYVGGRARGNWQHGLSLKTDVIDTVDKRGKQTVAKMLSSIPKDATGKVHYISNNVPYIHRLESGTLSRQAPQGMVAITVAEFHSIVKSAIGGIK